MLPASYEEPKNIQQLYGTTTYANNIWYTSTRYKGILWDIICYARLKTSDLETIGFCDP